MKGVIFNFDRDIKNIDGYNFMINIFKNLNIPWVELNHELIFNFDEIPIDIENCIFISYLQQNLNLAQSLNVKYLVNLDTNNKINNKHNIKNFYDLYNKYFNILFLN